MPLTEPSFDFDCSFSSSILEDSLRGIDLDVRRLWTLS